MTIADVLEKAADLIEPDGKWTQGTWGNAETCMCAEGAIFAAMKAAGYPEFVTHPVDFFGTVLPPPPPNKPRVPYWNDAAERTQEEVVAKLREAAKRAREAMS